MCIIGMLMLGGSRSGGCVMSDSCSMALTWISSFDSCTSMHLSYSRQCPNPFLVSPTTLPLQTLNTMCVSHKNMLNTDTLVCDIALPVRKFTFDGKSTSLTSTPFW